MSGTMAALIIVGLVIAILVVVTAKARKLPERMNIAEWQERVLRELKPPEKWTLGSAVKGIAEVLAGVAFIVVLVMALFVFLKIISSFPVVK